MRLALSLACSRALASFTLPHSSSALYSYASCSRRAPSGSDAAAAHPAASNPRMPDCRCSHPPPRQPRFHLFTLRHGAPSPSRSFSSPPTRSRAPHIPPTSSIPTRGIQRQNSSSWGRRPHHRCALPSYAAVPYSFCRMPPGPAVSMPPPGHRRVSPQPSERLRLFLRATTSPTRTRKQRRAAQSRRQQQSRRVRTLASVAPPPVAAPDARKPRPPPAKPAVTKPPASKPEQQPPGGWLAAPRRRCAEEGVDAEHECE